MGIICIANWFGQLLQFNSFCSFCSVRHFTNWSEKGTGNWEPTFIGFIHKRECTWRYILNYYKNQKTQTTTQNIRQNSKHRINGTQSLSSEWKQQASYLRLKRSSILNIVYRIYNRFEHVIGGHYRAWVYTNQWLNIIFSEML